MMKKKYRSHFTGNLYSCRNYRAKKAAAKACGLLRMRWYKFLFEKSDLAVDIGLAPQATCDVNGFLYG